MNKKILAVLLSLTLMQAPPAQAGFFDFFKKNIAFIGVAIAGFFALRSIPRASDSEQSSSSESSSSGNDDFQSRSDLADDPNDYQTSTQLVDQPSTADCTPTSTSHRCSYLESNQVASNSCVNTVNLRSGTTNNSGTGRSGN